MRPRLSPLMWVVAAYLGVVLGRQVMRAASSPAPPLTGAHGVALGLVVPVVFVAIAAAVTAWIDRDR